MHTSSKAIADELDEALSAGWIAAGIPQTALQVENPILKKALKLVARKARSTHVHTTVASFSHSGSCSQANTLAFIHMHEDTSVCSGRAIRCKVVGSSPPRHHAVLDDHLTKLYAAAESQLQSYVAALAERKRKAALLSDGKKMENGHPCVNFVFANRDNDGTIGMFCTVARRGA